MAAQLAGQGATVVCTARTAERAQEACAAAEAAWEGSDVLPGEKKGEFVPVALDHADLASVRAAGEEIAKRFPKVHQLHCNAGVMATPFGRTQDGFEQQWCINHLLLQILINPATGGKGGGMAGEARTAWGPGRSWPAAAARDGGVLLYRALATSRLHLRVLQPTDRTRGRRRRPEVQDRETARGPTRTRGGRLRGRGRAPSVEEAAR